LFSANNSGIIGHFKFNNTKKKLTAAHYFVKILSQSLCKNIFFLCHNDKVDLKNKSRRFFCYIGKGPLVKVKNFARPIKKGHVGGQHTVKKIIRKM
jgi:hypothetical protein